MPRKKQHVLPDGKRLHVPMMLTDAAYGFSSKFADGGHDYTSPHRKGFRFADTNDANGRAADVAYAERSRRMEDGWRHNKGDAQAEAKRDTAPPRTPTRDAAQQRAAADAAYAARTERMRNAWRQK